MPLVTPSQVLILDQECILNCWCVLCVITGFYALLLSAVAVAVAVQQEMDLTYIHTHILHFYSSALMISLLLSLYLFIRSRSLSEDARAPSGNSGEYRQFQNQLRQAWLHGPQFFLMSLSKHSSMSYQNICFCFILIRHGGMFWQKNQEILTMVAGLFQVVWQCPWHMNSKLHCECHNGVHWSCRISVSWLLHGPGAEPTLQELWCQILLWDASRFNWLGEWN